MKKKSIYKLNGFIGVIMILVLLAGVLSAFRFFVIYSSVFSLIVAVILFLVLVTALTGFTVIQPNQAKVFTLFGNYLGVIKKEGFWFSVPFTVRKNVSLRVINFNSDKLKVISSFGYVGGIIALIVEMET